MWLRNAIAKCNNQPNRQMRYVGDIQQSTSKLEDTVHIDNNTGSKSISPCFVFTHVIYYVFKWEMGLP